MQDAYEENGLMALMLDTGKELFLFPWDNIKRYWLQNEFYDMR